MPKDMAPAPNKMLEAVGKVLAQLETKLCDRLDVQSASVEELQRDVFGITEGLKVLRGELDAQADETASKAAQRCLDSYDKSVLQNRIDDLKHYTERAKKLEDFLDAATQRLAEIKDGADGRDGVDGVDGKDGTNAPVIRSAKFVGGELAFEDEAGSTILTGIDIETLRGATGDPGPVGSTGTEGRGIKGVERADTSLVLTMTDGEQFSLELPEGQVGKSGVGIADIQRKGDTAIVVLDDGTLYDIDLPKGIAGEKGDPGERGEVGTGIADVKSDGRNATFKLTDGTTREIELPVGPQGERGEKGERGSDGTDGEIGNGIRTIKQAGDEAHILFTDGTSAILNLPAGPEGKVGPTGEKGERGPDGEIGNGIRTIKQTGDEAHILLTDGTSATIKLPVGPKGATGHAGEKGERGPDGETGNGINSIKQVGDEAHITLTDGTSAVVKLPIGPQGERGEKGDTGLGIAGFDRQDDEFIVRLTDGSTKHYRLPDGIVGEKGDPGERGEKGLDGSRGSDGEKGDPGEPGERGSDGVSIKKIYQQGDSAVIELTTGDEHVISLPKGEKGDPGEPGTAGEKGADGKDGRDQPILLTVPGRDGERYDKNSIVDYQGGIWLAVRNTKGSPGEDPAGFACLLAGFKNIRSSISKADPRRVKLIVDKSDDTVVEFPIFIPAPRFRQKYRSDSKYETMDLVQHSRGLWAAQCETRSEPGTSSDWKLWIKIDEPKAIPPKKGDKGTGVDDVVWDSEEGVMTFALTDGSERAVAIPQFKADPQDEVYPPLTRYRGDYSSQNSYSRGEVVTESTGLYVAKTDVPPATGLFRAVHDARYFDRMVDLGSALGGGGGSSSTDEHFRIVSSNSERYALDPVKLGDPVFDSTTGTMYIYTQEGDPTGTEADWSSPAALPANLDMGEY